MGGTSTYRRESWPRIPRDTGICSKQGKLIGDVPSATAILDRFLHHAEIVIITGRSYRLKDHPATVAPAKPRPGKNTPEQETCQEQPREV
ncbi:MAG: ATP-binding protein [Planctomycetota bacterium]